MSFLAPLYALGLLAVAAPIWFHLIRRRPKGQVPFSSLMFLSASPPPPAQKRRLDQILLLLLRIAALALLGFAFMRPFLRLDTTADAGEPGQRTLILIDTSASLRRGDLWAKAQAQAEESLADVRPSDRVGVYAFDDAMRPVLAFDEADQLEVRQRVAVARDRVRGLQPTWGGTELGQTLIDGVGMILNAGTPGGRKAGKIVLVSDLAHGSRLTGLGAFEWPADVELELRTVADERGNAGLSLLADRAGDDRPEQLRVRVVNDPQSRQENFRLAWSGTAGSEIDAYVPPGESRVVKVSRPAATVVTPVLRLHGDAHDFDNAVHLVPPQRQEMTVFFLGSDEPNDPAGLRYFLERAWPETSDRTVKVEGRKPDEPLTAGAIRSSPLVVLNGEALAETAKALDRYARDGGTVLVTLTKAGPVTTLAQLLGVPTVAATEAPAERYAMLKDIAFDHTLFAPLSGPQFGDFTKVHFWRHRRLVEKQLPAARVLARFDDGDPAVLERAVGRGRVVVFASGWQPADSQLARSSKFVPMMASLLDLRGGRHFATKTYRVNERVPLPPEAATVHKPDGTVVKLAPNAANFDRADLPGVYVVETPLGPRSFAVNLDPAESLTAPLPVESLEQVGCRIAGRGDRDRREQFERQQRDVELERNQSIWRGLIVAALFVLIVETGLAGWRMRSISREMVAP